MQFFKLLIVGVLMCECVRVCVLMCENVRVCVY